MKTCSLIFGFSLLAAVLSGCTPSKAMQSLVGQPSTELIARWGPPHQRTPDGNGGEIWTYFEQREWTTPGQVNTTVSGTGNAYGNICGNQYGATYTGNTSGYCTATTSYILPQTHNYTVHRSFFINGDGVIYRLQARPFLFSSPFSLFYVGVAPWLGRSRSAGTEALRPWSSA